MSNAIEKYETKLSTIHTRAINHEYRSYLANSCNSSMLAPKSIMCAVIHISILYTHTHHSNDI